MSVSPTSRTRTLASVTTVGALSLVAAFAIAFWGAKYAEDTAANLLANVGALTRVGLPLTAVVGSSAATLTLGGTLLAGWILPRDGARSLEAKAADGIQDTMASALHWCAAARTRTLALTVGAAVVWTLASIAQLILSYSLSSGQAVGSPRFGSDIGVYMVTDLGVWMLWGTILAALASAVALAGDSVQVARAAAVVTLLGVMARAMTGHAAGDASHESATSSMFLHLVAVAAWVGPLVLLQVLPPQKDEAAVADFRRTVRRYSALALAAWLLLAFSGAIALYSRVTTLSQILTHPYGQLGGLKIVLLLALGILGYVQRGIISRTEASARRAFARVALVELVLMASAIGLGAAMSSSPPPTENVPPPPGPAGILTNYPLPPSPLGVSVLMQWRVDIFAFAVAALVLWWAHAARGAVAHAARGTGVAGVREASGSVARRAMLVGAAVAYVLLTSGPFAVYSRVLFSAHLLLSVLVMLAVGMPLAFLAGPGVLARIRALPIWAAWVCAAIPALLLGAGYEIPAVLRRILESHPGNVGFVLACIAAGALWGLLARGRGSGFRDNSSFHESRGAGGWRGVAWACAPLPFIAAFLAYATVPGIVFAPSWFGATGRMWLADALADQRMGALAAGIVAVAGAGILAAAISRTRGARSASGPADSPGR